MAFGGRSQLKMSEETFDFVCTSCAKKDRTVEAVKYCVECSGYCCQSCTDVHTMFPALENHNLLEVSQGKQASGEQSSVLEFPTERCSVHKGKVVDMYCESHDVVGCYACIAKDHKSCQDSHIHSIPDMIDAIFKSSDCKQTHRLLKDMMVVMETVSKEKDTQIHSLKNSKKEALDKVTTFEKALEAILRQRAESSRQEIEDVYKQLEAEILGDKHTTNSLHDDLKKTDEKLKVSEGNRAQRFVCSKIAKEQMKEAEREKTKPQVHNTDVQIAFIPDQLLMENIKAFKGIGKVQYQKVQDSSQKHDLYKSKKHDLYKIKGSRDISIKLSSDSSTCWSLGCCLTPDNQLLVTDCSNKKLKRIDIQKMSVIDYCNLDSNPYGVCCINKHEAAVACYGGKKIQFVSFHNQMSLSRQIQLSHKCYGIASNDDKIYVTDNGTSLYVYDMAGILLKTISQDNAGNKLFNKSTHITLTESGNRIVVVVSKTGFVCFDETANYVSTITDTELKLVIGVCIDSSGNVFAVGNNSDNVVQFSDNGKKVGVVVKKEDGIQHPLTVCFHEGLNRLFVTMQNSDVVRMYELE